MDAEASSGERVELCDYRSVRRTRDAVVRGEVDVDAARAEVVAAVTSTNAAVRAAGLDVVLALDAPAPLSLLEAYSPPPDVFASSPPSSREARRFARLLAADPAGAGRYVGDVASAAVEAESEVALSAASALAGRDPAVLKPCVGTLAGATGDAPRVRWVLARVGALEPAVLRRHLANATWTVERAGDDPAPEAVWGMATTAAALGERVPETVAYPDLLEHVDDGTRLAAIQGLYHVVERSRPASTLDWLDVPAVVRALREAVRGASGDGPGRAARVLGEVAAREPRAAATVVRDLLARLTDDGDVLTGVLAGLCSVAGARPDRRAPGTVRRIAARLGDDSDPELTVALLGALAAHGGVTVESIDLDAIAVHLGHASEEVRFVAVEMLLDLGAVAPAARPDVVRYLRWARHDGDGDVRAKAVAALGTAGHLYRSTAPTVVDALVDHLAQYPDDATAVASALESVGDESPTVLSAVVDRLLRGAASGDLPEGAVRECVADLGKATPAAVQDVTASLHRWAVDEEDGGDADAARALLAVARESPSAVTPHAAAGRAGDADADASIQVRAPLAATTALVAAADAAESGETEVPELGDGAGVEAVAWLADRTLEAPVTAGGALAVVADRYPETALPALETVLSAVERGLSREHALEVDASTLVERVVAPLVGRHPAAGPPVVRALVAALRDPAARHAAATVLEDALAAWPSLAPLAVDALVERLDDADGDTLRALVAPLSWVESEAADRALAELAVHPDAAVRRAAKTRADTPPEPPGAPTTEWVASLDPADATREDVDRLARGLCPAARVDATVVLSALRAIAREQSSLRPAVRCHLLGAIVADEGALSPSDVLAALDVDPLEVEAYPSEEDASSLAPLVALATDGRAVVRAQATTALVATVDRSPALATAAVSDHLDAAMDADSALVAGRALRGIRVLAPALPLDAVVDASTIESRLFRPPALVPRAAWTVAAIARQRPDVAEALAGSLAGVLDWPGLPRAHALRTIPDVLAAAPETETVLAPAILERLRTGTTPPDHVVDALGHLSGDALAAASDGATLLLQTLDDAEDPRTYGLAADRLCRLAEADPAALVQALEARDADALPPLARSGLAHYLRALERAFAHAEDRIWYPLVDVGSFFPPHEDVGQARRWADTVDRPVARVDLSDAPALRARARRSLVAILAANGHVEFLRVLDGYEDGTPAVEPTPGQIATWFERAATDAESTAVPEATALLCDCAGTDVVAAVGTRLADAFQSLPMESARRIVDVLPAFAAALPAGDDRRSIRDAIVSALDDDWPLALAAVDAVADLGTRAGFPAATALDALLDRLDASDPTMQERVADGVATLCLDSVLDPDPARDRLRDALESEPTSVHRRRASVLALGRLAAAEPALREGIVADLQEASAAASARVRGAALAELARVADAAPAAVAGCVDAVAARVTDAEQSVARAALECLRTVGQARRHAVPVASALVRALDATEGQRRETCAGALVDVLTLDVALPGAVVDRLREHVDDPHPGARARIVRALSYVGTPADRALVERARGDGRPVVDAAVDDARRRLDGPHAAGDRGGTADAPTLRSDAARTAAAPGSVPSTAPTEEWSAAPDWETDAGEPADVACSVVDGAVYVAGRTWVWALELATGALRWRFERAPVEDAGRDGPGLGDLFGDGGDAFDAARSAPTVADGSVYVGHAGDTSPGVYALDADTGAERWTSLAECHVETTPAVVDDAVLVGDVDGTLSAIATDDGRPRWQFDTPSAAACSTPATDGDTAFVLAGDNVHAVAAADGTERWSTAVGAGDAGTNATPQSAPAVRRDTVYVCPGGAAVVALDAVDGRQRWRVDLADAGGALAAVGRRRVFVGLDDGTIRAYDAVDGSVEWTRAVADHGRLLPAVVGDTLVAANATGSLHALSRDDGTEAWQTTVTDPLGTAPVVVDGTTYLVDASPRAFALD